MGVNTLEYTLKDGFIHNWLVTGPFYQDIAGLEDKASFETEQRTLTAELPQSETVADRNPVKVGGKESKWVYFRAREDHLVNFSYKAPVPALGYAWAYTCLETAQRLAGNLEIRSDGPFMVWVNGKQEAELLHLSAGEQTIPFSIDTTTELYIFSAWRADGVAARTFSVRVVCDPAQTLGDVKVKIPTNTKYPNRHQILEEEFDKAYLIETVSYHGKKANVRWAEDAAKEIRYAYQIQDDLERIYVEGTSEIKIDEAVDVGHPFRIFENAYNVVLKAPGREYYEMGLRYQRALPIYIIDNAYSEKAYAAYPARRTAALEDAARRRDNVFAEIAKIALGTWDKVEWPVIDSTCATVQVRGWRAANELLGLLGMLVRYADAEAFMPEKKALIAQAVWTADYSVGADVPESAKAMMLTGAVLAGQLFPEKVFAASGLTGEAQRAKAADSLMALIREKGKQGFAEWGSDQAYEGWIVALSHVAGLASDEGLSELSAVLLDKLLFLLASGNFKGILAMPAANSSVQALRSGQLQATSGIQRLLWGTGVFHRTIAGVVSLACSEYEFPSFFAHIAVKQEVESFSFESHGDADLKLFKTPDYALSSAQSYRAGQPGKSERIWQAYLGTEAVVYTTHPANAYDDDYHRPGFWCGNQCLPKVAQFRNVLVAIYHAQGQDWMGFTHAYFPMSEFEEHRFEDQWAFARKGDAYVALTAKNGLTLIKQGVGAFRELRSPGAMNIWVCILGNKAEFKDFRGFQKKIMKAEMAWVDVGVKLQAPTGEQLAVTWDSLPTINGNVTTPEKNLHIKNAYCVVEKDSPSLDVAYEGVVMRMDFR